MWSSTRFRAKAAWLVFLGCLLSAGQALAHPQLPGSSLQGEATLSFFGLRVYHAKLWTLPDFKVNLIDEQALVLELDYLRDFQGQAIAERSLQEMQRVGPIPKAQASVWLSQMKHIFPNVKSGDRISGLQLPGQGAYFWFNGSSIGQIDDPGFARLFFGIWLAPSTSEPDMRNSLLGLSTTRNSR